MAFCHDQTEEERGANPGLWADMIHEIQTVLANDFIFGGILDRFPKLKILSTEFELAWVLGFAKILEQIRGFDYIMGVLKLQMQPVDYLKTRIFHGFIDDVYAQYVIPHVGAERVLWGPVGVRLSPHPVHRTRSPRRRRPATLLPTPGGPGQGSGAQRRLGLQLELRRSQSTAPRRSISPGYPESRPGPASRPPRPMYRSHCVPPRRWSETS